MDRQKNIWIIDGQMMDDDRRMMDRWMNKQLY